ncbi:unnamed protein product [Polarella glacialis]|uniref:C2H2-type domain-containing protein n=1 Tax=Polarella glacialis TaxID=89957 RepID=A0A813G594_POLGL|nr:unnamed protein product [Polarella glacialis]
MSGGANALLEVALAHRTFPGNPGLRMRLGQEVAPGVALGASGASGASAAERLGGIEELQSWICPAITSFECNEGLQLKLGTRSETWILVRDPSNARDAHVAPWTGLGIVTSHMDLGSLWQFGLHPLFLFEKSSKSTFPPMEPKPPSYPPPPRVAAASPAAPPAPPAAPPAPAAAPVWRPATAPPPPAAPPAPPAAAHRGEVRGASEARGGSEAWAGEARGRQLRGGSRARVGIPPAPPPAPPAAPPALPAALPPARPTGHQRPNPPRPASGGRSSISGHVASSGSSAPPAPPPVPHREALPAPAALPAPPPVPGGFQQMPPPPPRVPGVGTADRQDRSRTPPPPPPGRSEQWPEDQWWQGQEEGWHESSGSGSLGWRARQQQGQGWDGGWHGDERGRSRSRSSAGSDDEGDGAGDQQEDGRQWANPQRGTWEAKPMSRKQATRDGVVSEWFCQVCNKDLWKQDKYERHIAEDHVRCPEPGCNYSGPEHVLAVHKLKHVQAADGKSVTDSPEEVQA